VPFEAPAFFLQIDELVKLVGLLKLVCLSSERGWVFYVIPMMKSGQEKKQEKEQECGCLV
jgi:hypothetical protein